MTTDQLLTAASEIKDISAESENWPRLHFTHFLFRAALESSGGNLIGTIQARNWPAGTYPADTIKEAQRRVCDSQGWKNSFDPASRGLSADECRRILAAA